MPAILRHRVLPLRITVEPEGEPWPEGRRPHKRILNRFYLWGIVLGVVAIAVALVLLALGIADHALASAIVGTLVVGVAIPGYILTYDYKGEGNA